MLASEQFLLRLAQMVVQATSCLICALLCAHCMQYLQSLTTCCNGFHVASEEAVLSRSGDSCATVEDHPAKDDVPSFWNPADYTSS